MESACFRIVAASHEQWRAPRAATHDSPPQETWRYNGMHKIMKRNRFAHMRRITFIGTGVTAIGFQKAVSCAWTAKYID